jgi:hypothetical protein
MLARLRSRLSYANVVATLALFVALGGSAVAASQITGDQVKDGSLTGDDIKNESIKSKDVSELKATDLRPAARARLKGARGPRGLRGPTGPGALQIHRTFKVADGVVDLFTKGGLRVRVKCSPSANPDALTFTATTDTDHSVVGIGSVAVNPTGTGQAFMPGVDDDFNTNEFQTIDVDDTTTVMSYGRGPNASPVVTATFLANYYTATQECKVVGTVVGG